MSGRKTNIEPAYRLSIPGVLLPKAPGDTDTWHPFLMNTDDLLELHQAIRETLGLAPPRAVGPPDELGYITLTEGEQR